MHLIAKSTIQYLIFTCILCFLGTKLKAQETDTITSSPQLDTIETTPNPIENIEGSVFFEFQLETGPSLGTRNFNRQFGFGLSYRSLSMGLYQNTALGTTSRTLVFPNEFDLIYKYGGGYIGISLFEIKEIAARLRVNYGHGDMVWERSDTKEDFIRDTFHMIKPEVVIVLIRHNVFHLQGLIGYRQFIDLELNGAENSDFSGLTLGLGIKLGYFQ